MKRIAKNKHPMTQKLHLRGFIGVNAIETFLLFCDTIESADSQMRKEIALGLRDEIKDFTGHSPGPMRQVYKGREEIGQFMRKVKAALEDYDVKE